MDGAGVGSATLAVDPDPTIALYRKLSLKVSKKNKGIWETKFVFF